MLKKILIAFFLAFFPFVFCAIDNDFFVYADNTMIQEDYTNVPIVNEPNLYATYTDSGLWGRINSNNYYYAMWYVDIPDTNQDYFVIIAYQTETIATPHENEAKTSINYVINSASSYVQGQIWKYSGSSWGTFTFMSSFVNSNTLNGFSIGGTDNVNYLCGGNVPCIFNGEPVEPEPEAQGDTFICNNDGLNINIGVFAGPASHLGRLDNGIPYYFTDEYVIDLNIEHNNQTLTVTVPSYLYWTVGSSTYIEADDSDILSYIPMFSPYVDVQYSSSMRSVRAYQSTEPAIIFDTDFNKMQDFHSFNTITINQLYNAFNTAYPNLNLAISDLYTEIVINFYKSDVTPNVLKKTYTIDFSSTPASYVPPSDKGDEPNPFDSITNLNNTMISNNKYLKDILYGEQYIKHGWGEKISNVNFDGLNTIPTPSYTFTEENLDTDALGFFGWLVEFWYGSPFGLIALVSLTFLVIRTIIW